MIIAVQESTNPINGRASRRLLVDLKCDHRTDALSRRNWLLNIPRANIKTECKPHR